MALGAQVLGEFGELLRRDLGDVAAREARPEPLGFRERPLEPLAVARLPQAVEVELVARRDRVGPVGDDPEAIEIAGDQKRRVLERERVALQLVDRVVEAPAAALVLSTEAAAPPDVRPALAAGRLGRAPLEAIPLAFGNGVGRLLLVEQLAEVVEVGLRRGPLLQLRCLPFLDELLGGHGSAPAPLG